MNTFITLALEWPADRGHLGKVRLQFAPRTQSLAGTEVGPAGRLWMDGIGTPAQSARAKVRGYYSPTQAKACGYTPLTRAKARGYNWHQELCGLGISPRHLLRLN